MKVSTAAPAAISAAKLPSAKLPAGAVLGQNLKSISIIGLGLIGMSFARAVKAALQSFNGNAPRITLCGYDNNFSAREQKDILPFGIDRFETNLRFLCASDAILLAAPVQENIKILKKIKPFVKSSTLIADMSSTKAEIAAAAEASLPNTFIGLHPVAGSEKKGYQNSSPTLFAGKPFAVCASKSDLKDLKAQELLALIKLIGGEVFFIEPQAHDELFARISHLPQLLSVALAEFSGDDIDKAGAGLHDWARLSGSSYDVWQDIFSTNRDHVADALDAFSKELKKLSDAVRKDDHKTLRKSFERANKTYEKLSGSVKPD